MCWQWRCWQILFLQEQDGDNILLNHKIFDTNKNIRHRQRDNILCPCHQCLLHSTSPTIPMFGFSFRRDFYLFAIINNSFNRLGSIKNCAKNIHKYISSMKRGGGSCFIRPISFKLWYLLTRSCPVVSQYTGLPWDPDTAPVCCNSSMFSPNE